MKRNKRYLVLAFIVGMVSGLSAQDDPQFSQYMFNKLVYNPAVAGHQNAIVTTLDFRSKWLNMEGQPLTESLSAHAPVSNLHGGVGAAVVNDEVGAQRSTTFMLSYAYRQPLGKGTIAFGGSGGLVQHKLDGTKLRTPGGEYEDNSIDHNDDNVPDAEVSTVSPNFNLGIYYHDKHLYAGLSSTNLLTPTLQFDNYRISYSRNYYLTSGYRVELSPNINLIPSVLLKTNQSKALKTQLDINTNMVYKENFLVGVSYRSITSYDKDGIVAIAGLQLTPKLFFSYSYDFTFSRLINHSAGSHEVLITYKFNLLQEGGKIKTIYSPRFL